MAMVENIPLSIDADNAAVVVACDGQPLLLGTSAVTDIAVGNDDAAVDKIAVRIFAGCVAKFMAHFR